MVTRGSTISRILVGFAVAAILKFNGISYTGIMEAHK